jgi:hypothetical protein
MKLRAPAIVLLALAVTHPAAASTRLAVFITADDEELSQNLTEVAIASLAEKKGYELLGLRELESRLNELPTVKSGGFRACLAAPACLAEVGTMAGVERAVVGDVRREAEHYRLDLALVDTRNGASEARRSPESTLDLDRLIAAVQTGVLEIVPNAENEAPAPFPIATVAKPVSSQQPRVWETPQREPKPESASILPYIAYGTAALAVVAFSGAVVTGTLAKAEPEGATRAEVQADVERRKDYAAFSNALWVTGGVLAGTAAVTFAVSW